MKSVVITGTSTGIGRSTALLLDREGWRVFAGVRRDEDGEGLQKESMDGLLSKQRYDAFHRTTKSNLKSFFVFVEEETSTHLIV